MANIFLSESLEVEEILQYRAMEKLHKHQFINIILNDIQIVPFFLYTISFIYMYSILSVIIIVVFIFIPYYLLFDFDILYIL